MSKTLSKGAIFRMLAQKIENRNSFSSKSVLWITGRRILRTATSKASTNYLLKFFYKGATKLPKSALFKFKNWSSLVLNIRTAQVFWLGVLPLPQGTYSVNGRTEPEIRPKVQFLLKDGEKPCGSSSLPNASSHTSKVWEK